MNFAKYAKMAVLATAVTVSFWAQPQMAQAEEGPARGGGGIIIDLDIADTSATPTTSTDDVWVDGKIITAENYDAARRTTPTQAVDGQLLTADELTDEQNSRGEGTRGNGGGGDIILFDIVG